MQLLRELQHVGVPHLTVTQSHWKSHDTAFPLHKTEELPAGVSIKDKHHRLGKRDLTTLGFLLVLSDFLLFFLPLFEFFS